MEHMGMNEKQHKLVNKKSHQRISPSFPGMRCTKGKYWTTACCRFCRRPSLLESSGPKGDLGQCQLIKWGGGVQKVLPKHHHLQNGFQLNLKGW